MDGQHFFAFIIGWRKKEGIKKVWKVSLGTRSQIEKTQKKSVWER